MHPSSTIINIINNQQKTTAANSFCNNFNGKYSLNMTPLLEEDHDHQQPNIINVLPVDQLNFHQQPSFIAAAHLMHQMNKSSYNNNVGKFVAAHDDDNDAGLTDGGVRRRTSCFTSKKKDRHSKINTARGPRDRRMRLSLDVAKKFFRLQDILGFDKASNTIEWLLKKSQPAIQALILPQHLVNKGGLMSVYSNSASSAKSELGEEEEEEEEVVSRSIDDQSDQVSMLINNCKAKKLSSCSNKVEKKKINSSACVHHQYSVAIAKETREKARARARKRTTEKKINNNNIKQISSSSVVGTHDQYSISKPIVRPSSNLDHQNINYRIGSSWIPFGSENNNQLQVVQEAAAEYAAATGGGSNYNYQFKQADKGININMSSNNWISPAFLFNYQQHNPAAAAAAGPPAPSHDQQQHDHHRFISECQILGKPWELGEFMN